MRPLPKEDVFEAAEVHAIFTVDLDPLRWFLVFFKLLQPFFLGDWWEHSLGFPSDHWEARLRQASIPTQNNHAKNAGGYETEPEANSLFFPFLNIPLILDIENNRIEIKAATGWGWLAIAVHLRHPSWGCIRRYTMIKPRHLLSNLLSAHTCRAILLVPWIDIHRLCLRMESLLTMAHLQHLTNFTNSRSSPWPTKCSVSYKVLRNKEF